MLSIVIAAAIVTHTPIPAEAIRPRFPQAVAIRKDGPAKRPEPQQAKPHRLTFAVTARPGAAGVTVTLPIGR